MKIATTRQWKQHLHYLSAGKLAVALGAFALSYSAHSWQTSYPSMYTGHWGTTFTPLVTIGDTVVGSSGNYSPIGIMDGIGAYSLDVDSVRLLVNHEVNSNQGYSYTINGGSVSITGSRISFFDINKTTLEIEDAGVAINNIYDRFYNQVTSAAQINNGIKRLCSGSYYPAEQFATGRGFANNLYLTGEETNNGSVYAFDPATGDLHAAPDLGRAKWENAALLDTGTSDRIAIILMDDTLDAPLYLYLGTKQQSGDFLELNGLKNGFLYAWKPDNSWVQLTVKDAGQAGQAGYDSQGYANDATLRNEAYSLGARKFSRPEDAHTDPLDGTRAVLASTGNLSAADGDLCGTVYLLTSDFSQIGSNTVTSNLSTLNNCYSSWPNPPLRNPDNLTWSDANKILVQEDKAFDWTIAGAENLQEAGILSIDPSDGQIFRLATIDRTAVAPAGSTDQSSGTLGAWESSGIVDVSTLFEKTAGTLFVLDVQAHSIVDGVISSNTLVQGGQLLFMDTSAVIEGTASDNCPLVANPDQADLDSDSLGNVCDDDVDNDGANNIIDGDDDNDGVMDVVDLAPYNDAITTEITLDLNGTFRGFWLNTSSNRSIP